MMAGWFVFFFFFCHFSIVGVGGGVLLPCVLLWFMGTLESGVIVNVLGAPVSHNVGYDKAHSAFCLWIFIYILFLFSSIKIICLYYFFVVV